MNRTFCLLVASLAALLAGTGTPADAAAPRSRGLGLIRDALDAGPSRADAAARLRVYHDAVAGALPLVAGNVEAAETLRAAQARADRLKDDEKAAGVLRTALAEARDTLAFEPLREAELPEGFPGPTSVGEVRLKSYPAYRLARTSMAGSQGTAFWTLFGHIQKNKIAMTAPVEMTCGGKSSSRTAMAFLYRSTSLGKPGKDGKVEVEDVPAGSAVSIGVRGEMTEARIAQARKRLESWFDAHPEYASISPVRVMGYNSPFVPAARRYWEVEIPVRKAGTTRD
jgi:hypothetical protein